LREKERPKKEKKTQKKKDTFNIFNSESFFMKKKNSSLTSK